MATKSDNTIGNQWHSSEDGRFISGPNGESISRQDLTLANFGLGTELDLDELSQMVDLADEELSIDDFDDSDELTLDDFDEDGDEEEENLDEVINMSEEEYDLIYNQGRTIPAFDTMADVVKNLDSFFTDELIQKELTNVKLFGTRGGIAIIKNTNCSSGLAFDFITKARSAKVHFKGVSDDEFMEKLSSMPQNIEAISNWTDKNRDYITSDEIQDMFDVFLKGGKTAYIPTWHGVSGVQSHRDYKTLLCQYQDNVEGAADTVLIGDGCYDYACYTAFAKGYSYSGYNTGHDGLLLRLLLPIDKHTKVCLDDVNGSARIISGAPKNWKTKSSILAEYRQYLPTIQSYVRNKLTKAGISYTIVNAFIDSLDPNTNHNNRSVPLALMGYDYVFGNTDQIDIINPAKVLMNIEKYRADDD